MADKDFKDVKETVAKAAEALDKIAKPALKGLTYAIPVLIKAWRKGQEYYAKLPVNVLTFLLGFVFAFFGGMYPVLFASAMAAEYGGRQQLFKAVKELADETLIILEQSKKDDEIDADKDGVADVDELSTEDFIQRKIVLVLKKMNPKKVDTAISSIYSVWVSVVAVLSIKFAQTISLAVVIADFLKRPIDRFLAPTVEIAVPDEYDKWVPIVLGWIAKTIGMTIAWTFAAIREAFASSMKGGLMMSRSLYQELVERKIDLGGLITVDHEDSNADEYLSYIFAFFGFYFQARFGFSMPFPFNILLLPVEMAEFFIRWSVTN